MYSKKASSLLASVKASIGDRIRIIREGKQYEGLVMPRIEVGDQNCIVIKLDSGYNVGIDASTIKKISLIEKAKEKKKEAKPEDVKPSEQDIVILGCGGTIASKVEYKTGAVYPAITPEELISLVPQLQKKRIRSRTLFSLFSEDMAPKHWQLIAKEIEKEYKRGAKGIILMHGTDTMHYTAAALSFMIKTPIPIVLVGAQRSSDRGSSDNQMNLSAAIAAAETDIAEVMVCMHASTSDDFCHLHRGTKVRKLHTSRRDAFQSVNVKPLAKVFNETGKIELLNESYNKRNSSKLEIDTRINPNVGLIYTYPGIKNEFVKSLSKFYEGVVIAGTGLGHVPTNPFNDPLGSSILPAIKNLAKEEIPMIMAPQTIFGRLNMNIYSSGRALLLAGVIGNYCDWTPETATVKLMIALGRYKKIDDVKKFMLTNVAGEISERSEVI